MANGIYTQPIPVRDINEDIRYLGEVLARNAERKQKYSQAKIKALNDAKAKSDKLLFDQFEYSVSKLPKDFRESWLKYEKYQKELFVNRVALGDTIGASNVLTETANTFSEMEAYREQYDEPVQFANEVIADISLANEGLPTGYEYPTDFYNADNITNLKNLHQEGGKYGLDWSPSEDFSYTKRDGERTYIKRISELEGFNDPTALIGERLQFAVLSSSQMAGAKYTDPKTVKMMGNTLGSIVYDEYDKAENQDEIEKALAKGRQQYDLHYDAQYADSNHASGGQLRLTAIADAKSLGVDIPEEFIRVIAEGKTPDQYAREMGGEDNIGNYRSVYDSVKSKHKEHVFDLISDQLNIKDVQTRSGYKMTNADKAANAFIENIQFANDNLTDGSEGIQVAWALAWKDDQKFSIANPADATERISNSTKVMFDFAKNGSVKSITLTGGNKTDVKGDIIELNVTPIVLKPADGDIFYDALSKIANKTTLDSDLSLTNTIRKARDMQSFSYTEGWDPMNLSDIVAIRSGSPTPSGTPSGLFPGDNTPAPDSTDDTNDEVDNTTSTTGGQTGGQTDNTTPQPNDVDRRSNEGVGYVGQVNADTGEREGQGTMTYESGAKYVGEYKDGNRHGQGTYTWPSGNEYVGGWDDGVKHGQGAYTWADGDQYVGEYKDGLMHGKGTYTWPSGAKYVGEYKYDEEHGKGTRTYSDGVKYVGGWKDGKYHGQGTMTDSSGVKSTGRWEDGEFKGEEEN